jgi:hypothetical protein
VDVSSAPQTKEGAFKIEQGLTVNQDALIGASLTVGLVPTVTDANAKNMILSPAGQWLLFREGNTPKAGIRFNLSTGKLQFSNDAANWTDLGSGTAASGDSMWTLVNPAVGPGNSPIVHSQGTAVVVKQLLLDPTGTAGSGSARVRVMGGTVVLDKPLDAPQLCIAGVCKAGWPAGGGGGAGDTFWTATAGGSSGVGIAYGGNIGIGTNSLAAGNALTVQGNVKVSGTITAANFLNSDGTPIAGGGESFWEQVPSAHAPRIRFDGIADVNSLTASSQICLRGDCRTNWSGVTGASSPWTKAVGSDVVHLSTLADRVVVGGPAPYVGDGGRLYKLTVSGDAVFRGPFTYVVGRMGIGTENAVSTLHVKADSSVSPATRGITIQGPQDAYQAQHAARLFMGSDVTGGGGATNFYILRSTNSVDDGLTIRANGDVVAGRGLEVKGKTTLAETAISSIRTLNRVTDLALTLDDEGRVRLARIASGGGSGCDERTLYYTYDTLDLSGGRSVTVVTAVGLARRDFRGGPGSGGISVAVGSVCAGTGSGGPRESNEEQATLAQAMTEDPTGTKEYNIPLIGRKLIVETVEVYGKGYQRTYTFSPR